VIIHNSTFLNIIELLFANIIHNIDKFNHDILIKISPIILNRHTKGFFMLKKLTPLIVLALFAMGAYLMKKGMDNATNMAKPKKVE